MGVFSNLAPGGRSVSFNSLTGRLKNKNNRKTLVISILVILVLAAAGLVYADYLGKLNLGIFPKNQDEN